MDKLESIGSSLSNLTLYDIKSMYNQVRFISLVLSVRAGGRVELMRLDAFVGKECSIQCKRDGSKGARGYK